MSRSWILVGLVVGGWLAATRAAEPAGTALLDESFAGAGALPSGWWSEGSELVTVQEGRLLQNTDPGAGATNPHSVLWVGQEFAGDLRFEADVEVLSAKGNVNDVVVFFLFSDPDGTPLHETREARASGKQDLYTNRLNGYCFFYWGKGGVTQPANIRLRDCPAATLLLEADAYEILPRQVYHLAIEKRGTQLTLTVDGQLLAAHDVAADEVDNVVHERGLIGLKTWNTSLAWDNLKVTRLGPEME